MDIIKETLPSVAKKTTFLWIGFFTSNFYNHPMSKPVEVVSLFSNDARRKQDTDSMQPNTNGSHVFIQPIPPSLHIYYAGDVEHNAGVFVNAILKNPAVSLPAKYAFLYTSQGSMQQYLQAWIDVTGRRTTFVTVSLDEYEQIWGPYGKEIGLMLKAFEPVNDWTKPYQPDVIAAKDLGIAEDELVDLKAALEINKALL